ncbi:MAG: hypothetical protein J7515_20625 [Caulobacter sp.]|nr:hypothetical protein [Caulobacter sp.]
MLKSLVLSAVLLLAPGLALAQSTPSRPPPPRPLPMNQSGVVQSANSTYNTLASGSPIEQRQALAAAAEAGVSCDLTDGAIANDTRRNGVHTVVYEVACKDNLGWVVTKAGDQISAFDCLALMSSAKVNKKVPTCRLVANADPVSGLGGLTKKAGVSCKPQDGSFLGGGGQPAISRYEVRCAEGSGYIIDSPQPKSAAQLQTFPCADAARAGLACALKPKG